MNLSRLLSCLRGRSRRDLHLVMYTRQGCHLCESAWDTLVQAQAHRGFSLESVDVDTSAELAAQHGQVVPVVTVNGKVRFRGCVNPVLLRRILDAGEPGA